MSDYNQTVIDEFRAGKVTSNPWGDRVALVHHVGARSQQQRIAPLVAIPEDDAWLIAGTKAGAPEHPAWVANLRANPDTTIETHDEGSVPVRAEQLTGAERDAGWQRFLDLGGSFPEYETKTDREFPIVRLTRR